MSAAGEKFERRKASAKLVADERWSPHELDICSVIMRDDEFTAFTGVPETSGRVYHNPGLSELAEMVIPSQQKVLDVGCGTGMNMELLRDRGHECTGLTRSASEAEAVASRGFPVVVADLNARRVPFADASFDALVMSHVLEHLAEPRVLLEKCHRLLTRRGSVYIALPNVLFYKQRLEFVLGRFDYSDDGIMDSTHLRFFTPRSATELIESSGYRVASRRLLGGVPNLGARSRFPRLWSRLDSLGLRLAPGVFGYHMLFRADPRSGHSV